jgi:hypothetical protein
MRQRHACARADSPPAQRRTCQGFRVRGSAVSAVPVSQGVLSTVWVCAHWRLRVPQVRRARRSHLSSNWRCETVAQTSFQGPQAHLPTTTDAHITWGWKDRALTRSAQQHDLGAVLLAAVRCVGAGARVRPPSCAGCGGSGVGCCSSRLSSRSGAPALDSGGRVARTSPALRSGRSCAVQQPCVWPEARAGKATLHPRRAVLLPPHLLCLATGAL